MGWRSARWGVELRDQIIVELSGDLVKEPAEIRRAAQFVIGAMYWHDKKMRKKKLDGPAKLAWRRYGCFWTTRKSKLTLTTWSGA